MSWCRPKHRHPGRSRHVARALPGDPVPDQDSRSLASLFSVSVSHSRHSGTLFAVMISLLAATKFFSDNSDPILWISSALADQPWGHISAGFMKDHRIRDCPGKWRQYRQPFEEAGDGYFSVKTVDTRAGVCLFCRGDADALTK